GKELICRTGSRDWGSFISSVISYDDFNEYFKDLFVRYSANICLYTDIDSVQTKIKKVREQIRKAFFVCDPNANKLKRTYYELQAELFFLRKFVDMKNGQMLVVPDQEVIKQLKSYFVINKNFLSNEDIQKLFDKFKQKYGEKTKTTYKD